MRSLRARLLARMCWRDSVSRGEVTLYAGKGSRGERGVVKEDFSQVHSLKASCSVRIAADRKVRADESKGQSAGSILSAIEEHSGRSRGSICHGHKGKVCCSKRSRGSNCGACPDLAKNEVVREVETERTPSIVSVGADHDDLPIDSGRQCGSLENGEKRTVRGVVHPLLTGLKHEVVHAIEANDRFSVNLSCHQQGLTGRGRLLNGVGHAA